MSYKTNIITAGHSSNDLYGSTHEQLFNRADQLQNPYVCRQCTSILLNIKQALTKSVERVNDLSLNELLSEILTHSDIVSLHRVEVTYGQGHQKMYVIWVALRRANTFVKVLIIKYNVTFQLISNQHILTLKQLNRLIAASPVSDLLRMLTVWLGLGNKTTWG